jgi:acetyl-CoA carboxylase biotin carboxyl carrier protein
MTDDLEPMAVGPGQETVPNGVSESQADAGPIDASTTPEAAADAPAAPMPVEPPTDGGDRELLRLIDRLAALLDRSDLTELEVESGSTGLVLRKPAALAPISVASVAATSPAATPTAAGGTVALGEAPGAGRESGALAKPSVKAPLTGIFYASPAPGSGPYVSVGGEVAVGQIIGLIEAMKLFNEIKSDLAGRVVRVVAESGALVKAKQPLIEVEPL